MLILLPALGLITALSACSGSHRRPAEIRFALADAQRDTVRSLQVYVYDVQLVDERGAPHDFALTATAPWQTERVALLDLAGDPTRLHTALTGTVTGTAPAAFSAVRFTIGVPFDLNHGNPLEAAAPLDRSDMFWTWQSGHKFMRVDLVRDGHEWSFHLGSTGCSSASALRPPAAPCAQPNRMRVELKGDPLRKAIRFDPQALFMAAGAANYAACTGAYEQDPACTDAFASTGLSASSGDCAEGSCSGQRLWTIDP